MTIILHDEDLAGYASMPLAIDAVEAVLLAKARGKAVSPPRHNVSFPGHGDLVFTIGGTLGEQPVAGFRVYDTFDSDEHSQIVAVWSAETGRLKGLVLGQRLGAIRTGAIGGVAIRHLSAPTARIAAVLGSGRHARTQLAAAAAVRSLDLALVYSRNEANRMAFAQEMQRDLGIEVRAAVSVSEAVGDADIVICATSSPIPVVSASDLKAGVHVTTIGPKTAKAHELALDIVGRANVIATDSREQTGAYASPFFLHGSGKEQSLVELSDIVAGRVPGRQTADEVSLFCSVGLAGTEVAVASALFDRLLEKSAGS
ncbi:ornithine cyclodeaminase family protein [Allorhizobium taibaishanense]|uniref:Ornithine cyclodeaminase n=1 Tax=Allorhizobium taibaishanense TaxID=887144 RepID=A0A1Q9A4F2_9HYPH|nr:ornithine cyclodeaminase family protein [Allorhizobium taibaishanense]MBB4006521.1 ornithine cyclodeaminase [Allorhizobium taibaishanense]OLP49451.1 ornithine cyclodeaminase [Allorhizobium taibaishanense]